MGRVAPKGVGVLPGKGKTRAGEALISSGLEVHCVGDQAWELQEEWARRVESLHYFSKGREGDGGIGE